MGGAHGKRLDASKARQQLGHGDSTRGGNEFPSFFFLGRKYVEMPVLLIGVVVAHQATGRLYHLFTCWIRVKILWLVEKSNECTKSEAFLTDQITLVQFNQYTRTASRTSIKCFFS